jgi:hypothetical protein
MEAAHHPWPALGALLLRDGLVNLTSRGSAHRRGQQPPTPPVGSGISIESGRYAQVAQLLAEQYELPFARQIRPEPPRGDTPSRAGTQFRRSHQRLPAPRAVATSDLRSSCFRTSFACRVRPVRRRRAESGDQAIAFASTRSPGTGEPRRPRHPVRRRTTPGWKRRRRAVVRRPGTHAHAPRPSAGCSCAARAVTDKEGRRRSHATDHGQPAARQILVERRNMTRAQVARRGRAIRPPVRRDRASGSSATRRGFCPRRRAAASAVPVRQSDDGSLLVASPIPRTSCTRTKPARRARAAAPPSRPDGIEAAIDAAYEHSSHRSPRGDRRDWAQAGVERESAGGARRAQRSSPSPWRKSRAPGRSPPTDRSQAHARRLLFDGVPGGRSRRRLAVEERRVRLTRRPRKRTPRPTVQYSTSTSMRRARPELWGRRGAPAGAAQLDDDWPGRGAGTVAVALVERGDRRLRQPNAGAVSVSSRRTDDECSDGSARSDSPARPPSSSPPARRSSYVRIEDASRLAGYTVARRAATIPTTPSRPVRSLPGVLSSPRTSAPTSPPGFPRASAWVTLRVPDAAASLHCRERPWLGRGRRARGAAPAVGSHGGAGRSSAADDGCARPPRTSHPSARWLIEAPIHRLAPGRAG